MSEVEKSGKSQFSRIEEEMLAAWQSEKTFEKSVSQRENQERFNFNDGPPFANGLPHFGHSLVTGIKDSILRYKTMRGYYVPRRNGWDCHGLPVEYAIEKQFGVSGKKQILELGLEKFNAACRDSIFTYKADWETFLKRYGRWSDYEHYYATVDRDYTESVWWILSEINKKGLLYKGFKSLPYCPRCATPLSNFELNEGYQDNVPDPSVFAYFPLLDDPTIKLLAWTTTPWTLPANAALAVDQDADYAYVKLTEDGSTLILAKDRLDVLDLRKNEYRLVKTVKGKELLGLRYQPLYELPEGEFSAAQAKNAHQVLHDDSVSLEDGTGILHSAPRYGEADLAMGQKHDLPLIESVDSSGHLIYGPKEALGKFFKAADEHIIADLTHKGKIFAAETAEHTYPFCWRCDTPLMYFATDTWFVEVTKVKDQMLKTAEQINWVPGNIKAGRWGKWLEGARDWAISRNRYWGAPLPIWVNTKDETDYIVVESIARLKELAGDDIKVDDLHRPFIDEISFTKDGKTYKRVEEVIDCWFESGSMPAAQWHYPFENKEKAESLLTADFITEGLDQTRLWFYVQHVISTILFDRPAFKNVIVTGIINAADGQKLSKRLKNYPPTDDVFDHEGADAWRLYLLSSVQATETADYMRFRREAVTDLQRNILGTLLNSFRFFKTYSELDKWQPKGLERPGSNNILDQWVLIRLNETITAATKSADDFKIAHAIEPVIILIDDLSNWYIRRSRKRFWKSENDGDKQQAYSTLHYCLMRISQLLAPWAPFTSDYLWRQLVQGTELPESVHLSDWPSVNEPDNASRKLLGKMANVRQQIVQALAQRAEAGIKVRQPLSKVSLTLDLSRKEEFAAIVHDEVNVKEVIWGATDRVVLDTLITPELKSEGIARDLIRFVQNARKNAGFNVEDRIQLKITSESAEITEAITKFKDTIFGETLATGELDGAGEHSETVKLDGQEIKISLKKAD
jgi:isoleucyl-tRNA synthetase